MPNVKRFLKRAMSNWMADIITRIACRKLQVWKQKHENAIRFDSGQATLASAQSAGKICAIPVWKLKGRLSTRIASCAQNVVSRSPMSMPKLVQSFSTKSAFEQCNRISMSIRAEQYFSSRITCYQLQTLCQPNGICKKHLFVLLLRVCCDAAAVCPQSCRPKFKE